MNWTVELQDDFIEEFESFTEEVQDSIVEKSNLLKRFGTQLGRPVVDTLKGSDFSNMKELRFNVGQEVWRVAFAFDPERKAILLVGANKRGKDQKRFYKHLIRIADNRYLEHLINLKNIK
jgi:hypothetical protein